jgi:hypothetical protein
MFHWHGLYDFVYVEQRETNMATVMSKPDFHQNALQFINDIVMCIGLMRFEYMLCKNYV